MSDSDDTDFLLFIPPNFFNISSPECFSPVDHSVFFETDPGVSRCNSIHYPIRSLTDAGMESKSTPLLNRFNGKPHSSSHLERNDVPLSLTALESSPLRHEEIRSKTSMCNTWPIKTNESSSMVRDNVQQTLDADDILRADYKITRPFETSGKTSHENQSSKFNLSQVDQLLIEMEKTRAEIKNKLQSNKSRISEMRRDCIVSKLDVNHNQDRDNSKLVTETTEFSNSAKNISNVLIGKDTNSIVGVTNSSTRNQPNFDLNLGIPGRSKNMLQLSQIVSSENNTETLQQKLEVEILKKKHCEEIIQELQSKVLELEQNLSVAQKIDVEKEDIIKQLQNAWLQLVEHWKELEKQRQELALMLEQERVETRNMNISYNQKIETLENRLHETISLASGYHQKNEELEKSLKQMQDSVVVFEDNFRKTEEYSKLMELEKSKILEQLRQTNENLTAEKQKSFLFETKIADLENQATLLISEKNNLLTALREEKDEVNNLRSEITKLSEDYSRVLNAESQANQQMSTMKQEILKAKNNWKDFYQNQLDTLLRKKIEEFQKEFQKAQNVMRQELLEHERVAEERLRFELKQLQDLHKIELSEERRVNQKHVNILKNELKESRKKIHELESRLKCDSSSKAELAKRVQSVLKNQWMEALNVISGNNDLSKDFLTLNINAKNTVDTDNVENENESSDLEVISNRSHKVPFDLRNYISVLLEKEPGNPVNEYKNLELLLSGHKAESSDKKSSEAARNADNNYRKKPPWK